MGREGASLVQGEDERQKLGKTCGKGKGKGKRRGFGGKGAQQSMKTTKGEEDQVEEDERVRVAPDMVVGGSHLRPRQTRTKRSKEGDRIQRKEEER